MGTKHEDRFLFPLKDLLENQKVVEGKKLILDALKAESAKITSVKPPDPALKSSYASMLKEFAEFRGNPLRYPYIGSGRGNGALVELLDGSVKYDFITGIGVYALGHCQAELAEATLNAALSNTLMQGNLQQNSDSKELQKLLSQCSHLPHSILTTSGAIALENALKIAFQKKAPAQRILAFEHCFAGRTLALSQITDKPTYREGLPPTLTVDYLPFYDPAKPKESIENAVSTLNKYLGRYPHGHAAMIFELIQGEGGVNCGATEFFKPLMEILRKHQIPIIADEVQTFGRTPRLFAFQYFGLEEFVDICCIGKLSLACATLFKSEITPRPGLISQTFTSSTAAIQSAIVIIRKLLDGNFYGPNGKIEQLSHQFTSRLKEIESRHPHLIKGPYGVGGMIAFTPFGGDAARTNQLADALFDAGLITFTAGTHPMRIRMLPPFGVLKSADIDAACKIIEQTLTTC